MNIKLLLILFLYGQFVAFMMAISNYTSGLVNRFSYDYSIWISNNTFQYLVTFLISQAFLMTYYKGEKNLGLIYKLLVIEDSSDKKKSPFYYYIIIGFLDVVANLLVSLSLRYTSITDYSMISNSISLTNMILSIICRGTKFVYWNWIGSSIAFVSCVYLTIYGATLEKEATEVPLNPLLGNLACFVSVLMFTIYNVLLDWMTDIYEFDTFMFNRNINLAGTIFNFSISFIDNQMYNLIVLFTKPDFVKVYTVNTLVNSVSYFLFPHFISWSNASLFGVVCLLSNFYTAILDYLLNEFYSDWIELICYIAIFLGAIVYYYGDYVLIKEENQDKEIKKETIENLVSIK